MRPETITSWDRGRDQDQLLWDRDRDWDQKSGLETTLVSRP